MGIYSFMRIRNNLGEGFIYPVVFLNKTVVNSNVKKNCLACQRDIDKISRTKS